EFVLEPHDACKPVSLQRPILGKKSDALAECALVGELVDRDLAQFVLNGLILFLTIGRFIISTTHNLGIPFVLCRQSYYTMSISEDRIKDLTTEAQTRPTYVIGSKPKSN